MIKNKSVPWQRIFSEGLIIIISILLAFAIDAWWDEHNEQRQVREHLLSVRSEFQQSIEGLEALLSVIKNHREKVDELIETLKQANGSPVMIRGELLGSAVTWRTSEVSYSTLDALLTGGGLNLLPDVDLRADLAGFPAFLLDINEDEILAQQYVLNNLIPYFTKQGLAEVAFAYREGFTEQDGYDNNAPTSLQITPTDELIGLLAIRKVHLLYSERGLPEVTKYLRRLQERIDVALDDS